MLGSIIGPHVGSIAGLHHVPYKNSGFRRFLLTKFSERGAKFSSFSGVLVQKLSFQKRDGSPFSIFCLGGCWWMVLLDDEKGGGK